MANTTKTEESIHEVGAKLAVIQRTGESMQKSPDLL
jgi:hypothetical protein